NRADAGAYVALRFDLDVHAAVGHAIQDPIRFLFDLRYRCFNNHGLYAASAKRVGQVPVHALLAPQRVLAHQALPLLALEEGAIVEFGLGVKAMVSRLVTGAPSIGRLRRELSQTLALRRQRERLLAKLLDALLVRRTLLAQTLEAAVQLGDLCVQV